MFYTGMGRPIDFAQIPDVILAYYEKTGRLHRSLASWSEQTRRTLTRRNAFPLSASLRKERAGSSSTKYPGFPLYGMSGESCI